MTNYKQLIEALQAEADVFEYSKIYGYASDVMSSTLSGQAKYPLCVVNLPPSKTGLHSENDTYDISVLVACITGAEDYINQQLSEDLLRTFLNNFLSNNKDVSIINDSTSRNESITVTRLDKVGNAKASGIIYSFRLLVYTRCLT